MQACHIASYCKYADSTDGPIAFALLIVTAIWLWWVERKAAHRKFTTEDLRGRS
jgi:hypothetical protein